MPLKYTSRTLATAPAAEPVTLTEAKSQIRYTASDEDDLINGLIQAAREYTEVYLSRALVAQTWDFYYDQFPWNTFDSLLLNDAVPLQVPLPPLISVSYVKYYDENNTEQTWAASNYTVDTDHTPALIYPAVDAWYPSTRVYPKAVNVRAICGYADSSASPQDLADNVPQPIKQAILMLIGHWWENRETSAPGIMVNEAPLAYRAVLAPYKVRTYI